MSQQPNNATFIKLRSARRARTLGQIAESAIFALMLAGLFLCAFIVTFGILGSAMDAPAAPYSIGGEQ